MHLHCTDGLNVVPVVLGVISSADEEDSDSLSEPVAKKRDIVERRCGSAETNDLCEKLITRKSIAMPVDTGNEKKGGRMVPSC